jgi:hypothetical protein
MGAKNLNLLFVHFTPGKSCHEGAENFCWGPSVTQLFHERRSAHHTLQGELASQFEFKNYFNSILIVEVWFYMNGPSKVDA